MIEFQGSMEVIKLIFKILWEAPALWKRPHQGTASPGKIKMKRIHAELYLMKRFSKLQTSRANLILKFIVTTHILGQVMSAVAAACAQTILKRAFLTKYGWLDAVHISEIQLCCKWPIVFPQQYGYPSAVWRTSSLRRVEQFDACLYNVWGETRRCEKKTLASVDFDLTLKNSFDRSLKGRIMKRPIKTRERNEANVTHHMIG